MAAAATPSPQEGLLKLVEEHGTINSKELARLMHTPHPDVIGVIKSVQSLGGIITTKDEVEEGFIVTEEGASIVQHGSYEVRVAALVPSAGIVQKELEALPAYKALGEGAAIGFRQAVKNKWIQPGREGGAVVVKKLVENPEDKTQQELQSLAALSPAALAEYIKRKLAAKHVLKTLTVSKGPNFTTTIVRPDTDLTPDMLADGSWRSRTFKPVNLDALGAPVTAGCLHPLLKVRAEYREIFLQMGFQEMPTNQFVESSFWNFDALFQPQQHPARDMHDTFFLTAPESCKLQTFDGAPLDQDYVTRVRNVHSKGGFGSQGYGYNWSETEAKKNILRTHTTAISAQMLYRLAKEVQEQKEFRPIKLFSIDRVFRNETLDATHLAEFHQIEGVVADYGLTLGDLMGTLSNFFERLGMGGNLRFKPAYNPYTEPSMEVFSYHPGLGRLVEVGNSGMFRPEMLRPMGLPDEVVVIAWGLSLERPTMIKYGYDNIRDLVGPKVDLSMAQSNPLCRL